MNDSSRVIDRELETIVQIACDVGHLIMRHYASEIFAEQKMGADAITEPVTAADREANALIVTALAKQFPDDHVLSEEEPDDFRTRMSHKRVWVVDPIDGTAGFIKKDDDFAVQIGLAVDGTPVVGVVYLPAHDTLYCARKGAGAFSISKGGDQRALRVSSTTDLHDITLAVSRNHRSPRMGRVVEGVGLKREVQRGSVGLKIGLIAEQTCDLYVHLSPRTKLWDTCAPQIILEEAGGKLTDLFGSALRYDNADVQNHNGVLASNGVSHDLVVKKLAPILTEFSRVPV
ncbi:MAG: 3'(2'),5'-bisphosphate nucleotidase CysQ [Pyrinomonadaceae bacterium]